jgi:Rrf2 family protein
MFLKSTEYALRAVVFLARNRAEGKRFGKKEIAERLNFPEPYLAKILQHLAKNGIIHSAKGPQGGFYATSETLNYSLLDIIEVNEGLGFLKQCGMGLVECNHDEPCPIHNEYDKVRQSLYKILSEKKIKEIIDDLDAGIAFMKFEASESNNRHSHHHDH